MSLAVSLPAGVVTVAARYVAAPSADGTGSPGALSPGRAWANCATAARTEAIAAWSAAVKPPLRANTTITGSTSGLPSPCWAACSSSTTFVESAEDGR